MTDRAPWKIFDFHVALRVIKHISSGIYRTPGGALKEIVNNAFDASARVVRIETGYPDLRKVVVRDDGIGMTAELVERVFQHIGASVKVGEDNPYEGDLSRPTIGQFGIGILASAHISKLIHIETFPRGEDHGIEIELDLRPYFEYGEQIKTLEEFTGGTVKYRKIPKSGRTGTTVSLSEIERNSNFRRAITKKGLELASFPSDSSDKSDDGGRMLQFVQKLANDQKCNTIERLQGRNKLLWELGSISPVEYLPGGPVEENYLEGKARRIVNRIIDRTKKLDFRLYLDGIQVRKPILLPTPKIRKARWDIENPDLLHDVKVFPIEFEEKKLGIRAEGYIVHQPSHVLPKELQGLYPRVKFVGVGRYENNLYEALRGEHPVNRVRLSGELYILSGLDDAINIDRSGFIELDQQFQALRDAMVNVFVEGENPINRQVKQAATLHTAKVSEAKRRLKTSLNRENIKQAAEKYAAPSKIELAAPPPKGQAQWIRYPSVSVDPVSGGVVVSDEEDDPRLVEVVLAVDKFLAGLPEGDRLRRELAEFLRNRLGGR